MATQSAGILLYRLDGGGGVSAFVAHMGGPYWASKDEGAWSVPKGELEDGEEALDAAKREFREELGVAPPEADYAELGTFAYSSGKRVTVFVADGAGFEQPDARTAPRELARHGAADDPTADDDDVLRGHLGMISSAVRGPGSGIRAEPFEANG